MQASNVNSQTRGRFARPRRLGFVWLALLAATACAWADTAYLPCIGPAPFRFRPVPMPAINVFIPPAPPVPEPEPPVEPPPVLPKTDKSVPITVPSAIAPPPTGTNQPTGYTLPDQPQPADVISPQMFLKYFNKSTNGPGVTVVAPVDFTPPKAAPAPSSKATYTITP